MKRIRIGSELESLAYFNFRMSQKLLQNDCKRNWMNYSASWLLNRLKQETKELARILDKADHDRISSECADIANFAMMIQDLSWNSELGE